MMMVEDLMMQELVTVNTGTSVVQAAKNDEGLQCRECPGNREGPDRRIVTESDVVKKFVGTEKVPYSIPVEEIMSSPVVGIDARRPITEAADLMNKYRARHLGVTKSGALVGVVSVRDFLKPVAVDDL
jgi:signal-transduction protein with cAMP-binding, CBS, and nucleotidyltransferase domain